MKRCGSFGGVGAAKRFEGVGDFGGAGGCASRGGVGGSACVEGLGDIGGVARFQGGALCVFAHGFPHMHHRVFHAVALQKHNGESACAVGGDCG
ncbi:hypothetical protein DMP06_07615 [Slackia equolifaciens]|uniref:Uncharacterized protein n=1 Tax=Slackia equolifaciens TaxID=498718 RepID=A0A3N0AX91_9ACTN|nr:hypothetical protein DMP06_07615 [Slackia equolifaciens]